MHTEKRSGLISKNITIDKKRTSVRLEADMWKALKDIALRENCSVHDICTLVNSRKKQQSSLTAAIRVFVMLYFKSAATEEGHMRAKHGDFVAMQKRAGMYEAPKHYATAV